MPFTHRCRACGTLITADTPAHLFGLITAHEEPQWHAMSREEVARELAECRYQIAIAEDIGEWVELRNLEDHLETVLSRLPD